MGEVKDSAIAIGLKFDGAVCRRDGWLLIHHFLGSFVRPSYAYLVLVVWNGVLSRLALSDH